MSGEDVTDLGVNGREMASGYDNFRVSLYTLLRIADLTFRTQQTRPADVVAGDFDWGSGGFWTFDVAARALSITLGFDRIR